MVEIPTRPAEPRPGSAPGPAPSPAAVAGGAPARDGWSIALGILLVIGGIAALLFPVISTVATVMTLGWLLALAGVVQLGYAFRARHARGAAWRVLIGLLWLAGGLAIALNPVIGTVTLTTLLSAVFLAQGVLAVAGAAGASGEQGRLWVILSGVVAIAAGLLIFFGLPSSALWALGVIVGANLLVSGASVLVLGSARRAGLSA